MKVFKFTLLLISISFLRSETTAQTSPLLRFSIQGTLKDGMAMSIPDGTYPLTFKLYNAPTGGTIIWQETSDVSVKGGLYSYLLGSMNPLDPADFGQTLYVGVEAEGYDFLPRTELTYSPAAMNVLYAGNGFPSGSVIPYASATIPPGWLLCNGQALSSASYPILYNALGTTYGNGQTGINGGAGKNFNVPDLRGEFIRGQDNGRGIDPGRTLGTAQVFSTKLPNIAFTGPTSADGEHNHIISTTFLDAASGSNPITHLHGNSTVFASGPGISQPQSQMSISEGDHTHTFTIDDGGEAETRPRNISMNYIIKL
jgi:microcystin-dependent protein